MANTTQSDFATLLEDYFAQLPKVGELVSGTVISIDNGAVRLDVNGLITGLVRGYELFSESSEYSDINVGDAVEATVVEQENETGEMELSFRIAGQQRVWKTMQKYCDDELVVKGKVIAANKGGLMIKVDALVGFMPVSQLAPEHYPRVQGGDKNRILEHLRSFVGMGMDVKVLDLNEQDEKLIVSEKAVWEDDQKAVLDSYSIGDIVEGQISALTSFGAFMKFGQGLEGLIHISEIVWQRIDHPKDVLKVGDNVKAQIIDLNKSKIYLSMKRLVDDPWKSVKETYKIGQEVEGEIHKIEPFGLMVKLDEDIHGLAHISEVSNRAIRDVKELEDMFTLGQKTTFEILNIDAAEHRLGLRLGGLKKKAEKSTEEAPKAEEPKVEEAPKEEEPKVEEEPKEEESPKAEEAPKVEEAPKEEEAKEEAAE
ncbi:MAG: S1 RNA-binding domain-containing protein [Candidatus Magasanikbacteria bacterium]|jgi:small subunit ribosomal protein S1|nr:S1 RNA-binding domain-containing protein [Candidatus Magasanikbacteria bacterium]